MIRSDGTFIRQLTVVLLCSITLLPGPLLAGYPDHFSETVRGPKDAGPHYRIDSIHIRRNWRTRDPIILRELHVSPGDTVTDEQLRKAMARIWNIGNFAKVGYSIDTLKDERILLNIVARDAVTVMPNLSFRGNRSEFTATLGVEDNNFLGRNISVALAGSVGTNARYANLNIGIPRQLLYKNMVLRSGFTNGMGKNYQYRDGKPVSGVAYLQRNAYLLVGNPWQTDDHYTFSPDLAIGYFNHQTDATLLGTDVAPASDYNIHYLTLSTGESIGMINRRRHQLDGYLVSAGMGGGIGLDNGSPGYFSITLNGTFSRLINRIVQITMAWSTGYTTAAYPSLLNYLGPTQVKGILSGERSGKAIWSGSAGVYLTYINRDWFAVEQSFFIDAGNAADVYPDLFRSLPLCSVGSGLRFMVPMVPWLGISLYYAWRGGSKHWFSVEF